MYRNIILKSIRKFNSFTNLKVNSSSALKETFNARPNLSFNLIRKDVGLFGVPELTSPEGFIDLTEKCIHQTDLLINEALNDNRKRKMVEIFDELSDSLCQVADLAEFIRFAHPSNNYSNSAENASIGISYIVEQLNTNLNLYKALKKSTIENDIIPTNEIDQLVAKLFLEDFEKCGIHLNENERKLVVELNNRILYLGQQFVNEISKPRSISKLNLPDIIKHIFSSSGNNVVISGLYADSPNPMVREIAYKTFLQPDSKQDKLLLELLTARDDLAKVCGFQTYSERALHGSILEKPKEVMEFLQLLSDGIREKANNDFKEMSLMKTKENPASGKLEMWDVPYFTHKAKKERFDVSAKEYSPYFSLGSCMEGLNLIFQSLYGISLINSEIEPGETWTSDVYKLNVVHEIEGTLGYIYCDFYERNSKPNQDCHFTIRGSKLLSNRNYQLPIVALMLNFSLPKWSTPTLLTPNMVDNLFHEMGHAMHSMLARTIYQHISGTRCSTDFAEVPSILMEYFSSDIRVLKLFAKHFQTKEAMNDKMLKHLCLSKKLFIASETQLQIFYSIIDQIYHGKHPLNDNTTNILANLQINYYGLPYVENTAWQLRFSHLVGYGAKYYSYLVSKALAHLIWKTYFKNDPLNHVQGEKYRLECLSHGGGKNPKQLIGDFLEVVPTPELLAKSLIDEIDEYQAELNHIR